MHPSILNIYYSLIRDVTTAIDRLQTKISTEFDKPQPEQPQFQFHPTQAQPANADAPSSPTSSAYRPKLGEKLPWFSHGIKGFLQKLWHGNSPNNPNWAGHRTESVDYLTLDEYNAIKDGLDEHVDAFFEEYNDLSDVLIRFKKELIGIVKRHMNDTIRTMRDLNLTGTVSAPTTPNTTTTTTTPTTAPVTPSPTKSTASKPAKNGGEVTSRSNLPEPKPAEPEEEFGSGIPKDDIPKKPTAPLEAPKSNEAPKANIDSGKLQGLAHKLAAEIDKDPEGVYDKGYEFQGIVIDGKKFPAFALPSNIDFKEKNGVIRAVQEDGPDIPAAIEFFNNLPDEAKMEIYNQWRHHLASESVKLIGTIGEKTEAYLQLLRG
jgi:hypothetical protein